jgi:CYTH domain-containing protein
VLAHTTLYLDAAEFDSLSSLPGDRLRKTRRHVPIDGAHALAVDTFHDALDGLVLAELDLGADRVLPATLPHGLGPDVTHDERFTGSALARTDGETLHALLATLGL